MLTLLSVLLLIFQLFCLLIPVINKTGNSSHSNYSIWDKFLIGFSIIAFGLSIAVFVYTQDQEEMKKKQEEKYQDDLKNKLAERDSLHQVSDSIRTVYFVEKLDSSYSKSIKSSNEALAKYNLILIDSMRTTTSKINIKNIQKPQLELAAASRNSMPPIYLFEEDNKIKLKIRFVSSGNTSYNINIRCCVIKCNVLDDHIEMQYSDVDTGFVFQNKASLTVDRFTTTTLSFRSMFFSSEYFFILMTGNFSSDYENNEKMIFEEGIVFNTKLNKTIEFFSHSMITKVKVELKKNGFIF